MFDVIFPEKASQKYYETHFKYFLSILKYLNCNITFRQDADFVVTINGKDFLIDYADTNIPVTCSLPIFKFHCTKNFNNIFPFPPISFYDWNEYYKIEKEIKYTAQGYISYRQRDYGTAIVRRMKVRAQLLDTLPGIKTDLLNQEHYWKDINNCLVSIFVPGCFNNMLDRGQIQYMALGCCTISPEIPEFLPFGKRMYPQVHYVKCADDYSDLIQKITFCRENRNECLNIGKNAKELFQNVCTPKAIADWIKSKL